jgi:hypothetical protein
MPSNGARSHDDRYWSLSRRVEVRWLRGGRRRRRVHSDGMERLGHRATTLAKTAAKSTYRRLAEISRQPARSWRLVKQRSGLPNYSQVGAFREFGAASSRRPARPSSTRARRQCRRRLSSSRIERSCRYIGEAMGPCLNVARAIAGDVACRCCFLVFHRFSPSQGA